MNSFECMNDHESYNICLVRMTILSINGGDSLDRSVTDR